ncbi:hypothetical protein GQ607_008402 [Colletotrichum asianum]|uniref:Cell wall protein DAN4 n=1 Tax=Colletotrichum asianum TaxID=702518 RepID=A0A8H3WH93_9PEZI|nr:hypothetical protein GQ607_008402 [Colletotrichum asianum]
MVSAVAFAACILSLQFAQATNDGVYEDNGLKQHSGNDFRSSRMPMFKRQATAGVESPVPVLQFVLTIMDFTSSTSITSPTSLPTANSSISSTIGSSQTASSTDSSTSEPSSVTSSSASGSSSTSTSTNSGLSTNSTSTASPTTTTSVVSSTSSTQSTSSPSTSGTSTGTSSISSSSGISTSSTQSSTTASSSTTAPTSTIIPAQNVCLKVTSPASLQGYKVTLGTNRFVLKAGDDATPAALFNINLNTGQVFESTGQTVALASPFTMDTRPLNGYSPAQAAALTLAPLICQTSSSGLVSGATLACSATGNNGQNSMVYTRFFYIITDANGTIRMAVASRVFAATEMEFTLAPYSGVDCV